MKKRSRKSILIIYLFSLVIFFEIISHLILSHIIDSERLSRFDDIYIKKTEEYCLVPHPYLKYIRKPFSVTETERYLEHLEKPRENKIFIVALGGSTTRTGYPKYAEDFINEKLKEINSPLRAIAFNFGVEGWSSIDSTQLYFYLLKYLHPDYVVIHHNHNEGKIRDFLYNSHIEYYPYIGSIERTLISKSKFYRLLKYVYVSLYNTVVYRKPIGCDRMIDEELPMIARISAYINALPENMLLPRCFERDFVNMEYKPGKWNTYEFILKENYASLARYIEADNGVCIVTTQYQNLVKAPDGKLSGSMTEMMELNDEKERINKIIRDFSIEYETLLIDLDELMEPYDHLLIDELHFSEEGVKKKGEFVGEAIWKNMIDQKPLSFRNAQCPQ